MSAAILAPVALLALWIGGWLWDALVAVAAAGLAHEWWTLTRARANPALLLAGVPYVGAGIAALLWLRADPEVGRLNVLFVAMLIWATDIGAYAAGRILGGPRLAPAISPGKTWSGAIGGLIAAVVVAFCVAGTQARPFRVIVVATLLSVVAQAGDLLESAIKRWLGVKDSGTLIPGHGGLFDRLDGFLTAAPAAGLLAIMLGRGVELWR
jgi:phosphatidate cytidylyltransferase